MTHNIGILLDRLAALRKSQLRKAASALNMQVVHLEILRYLEISNRYSNTAQAVCEYLGQTKGSISQSIKLLESEGFLGRQSSDADKRVTKLILTESGKAMLELAKEWLRLEAGPFDQEADAIQELLRKCQSENGKQGFGICRSCRFNKKIDSQRFYCELTQEALLVAETELICREHKFP